MLDIYTTYLCACQMLQIGKVYLSSAEIKHMSQFMANNTATYVLACWVVLTHYNLQNKQKYA